MSAKSTAALLGDEMDWVMRTLATASLFEMWMQALLVHEDTGLPGWHGVTLQRPQGVCLRALDRLVGVEDLPLLLQAYDMTRDFSTRISLLKLVEAVTLSRFIIMPTDEKAGWGRRVFHERDGLIWRGHVVGGPVTGARCTARLCLTEKSADDGGVRTRPLVRRGMWRVAGHSRPRVLPQWWMLASRQLYACGGPWVEISALSPEKDPGPEQRKILLQWFQPLMPGAQGQTTPR